MCTLSFNSSSILSPLFSSPISSFPPPLLPYCHFSFIPLHNDNKQIKITIIYIKDLKMMNVVLAASSECSSGCESGWTLYLEHSSSHFSTGAGKKTGKNYSNNNSKHPYQQGKKSASLFCNDDQDQDQDQDQDEDEEEDLSMVSDASSGPPHFDHDIDEDEDEDEVFCYGGTKKQSVNNNNQQYFKAQDFGLDDTASSPFFTSNNKMNNGENRTSSLKRMVDYSSQGFSTTHFHQGESTNLEEHYGLVHAPFSTNQYQQNQWS
ncbi:protein SOB FIVE-LIKE 5 [Spinacia oleracea]|uniref:Protein SOB FIVE-LIKE 5 n=1 Tax=Spinacia oleracea TaxID=3562 RepID=A0A9R0JFS4_SPIOL|nr:protein SOB FIVE-LIKE 5-like [Spinacia oleracea]